MTKGKRPVDPGLQSDTDLLDWIPILEAISRPDTIIEPDAPILQLSAISIARLAEGAVEQHAPSIRQGKTTDYRKRARRLIESTLCEAMYINGHRTAVNALASEGLVPQKRHEELIVLFSEREKFAWRTAAHLAATLLSEIKGHQSRRGVKGKPDGAVSVDALMQLVDSEIMKVASDRCGPNSTKEVLEATFPSVVREYLENGRLNWLGDTEQQAVDRHSKRIRQRSHALLKSRPIGGSSTIRKS
jgi:hypothetical protein